MELSNAVGAHADAGLQQPDPLGELIANSYKQACAERDRYKAALVALSRHADSLRATNWPGLANIIERALEPEGRAKDDLNR